MRGKIVSFRGTWGSGLATLTVCSEKRLKVIPCENGPTVRALEALFPGFISSGHTVNNEIIKGQEIEYEMDDMGLGLGRIGKAP